MGGKYFYHGFNHTYFKGYLFPPSLKKTSNSEPPSIRPLFRDRMTPLPNSKLNSKFSDFLPAVIHYYSLTYCYHYTAPWRPSTIRASYISDHFLSLSYTLLFVHS